MKFLKAKSNAGFGILEALIGGLLMMLVAIGVSRAFSFGFKAQRSIAQATGADSLRANLEMVLRNPASCLGSLSGLNPDITTPQPVSIRDAAGNTIASPGQVLTDNIVVTNSNATFLETTGGLRQLLLKIEVGKPQTGKFDLGRHSWFFEKYLNAVVSGSSVVGCSLNGGGLLAHERYVLNTAHVPAPFRNDYRLSAVPGTTYDSASQTLHIDRTDLNVFCDPALANNNYGCVQMPYVAQTVVAKGSYIVFQASGNIGATSNEAAHGIVPIFSVKWTCGATSTQQDITRFAGFQGIYGFGLGGTSAQIGYPVAPGDVCTMQAFVGWNWVPGPPTQPTPVPAPVWATVNASPVEVSVFHYQ